MSEAVSREVREGDRDREERERKRYFVIFSSFFLLSFLSLLGSTVENPPLLHFSPMT